MAIVLAGISALEYWRATDRLPDAHAHAPCDFGSLWFAENATPSVTELAELPQRGLSFLAVPITVMVPSANLRAKNKLCRCEVCTERIPKDHLIKLAFDIYVVSPRICAIQLARKLSVPATVRLLYELGGSYRLRSAAEQGFVQAYPLLNPSRRIQLSAAEQKMSGSARFRTAVSFALAGSASPMETALAMLLSMPSSYGGYGLPAPQMNVQLDNDPSSPFGERRYYRPDLYWKKEGLIVEYDSKAFHSGAQKISQDADRRNALLYKGMNVVTVSTAQIMDSAKFSEVASLVARNLGKRLRFRSSDWADKHYRLRREVLPHRQG